MSLLAALTPDAERTLPPASGPPWRAEFLKFPGRYEPGAGAPDGRCADTAAPAGDGFSDWMTERVDFSLLMESGDPSLPSSPLPDLEAMASLLKKELEQMEDYFLDESLSPSLSLTPDQVAPSTPPSHQPSFHFPFGDAPGPADSFPPFGSSSTSLQTLDSGCLELLTLCGAEVPGECQGQGLLEEQISNPSAPKLSRLGPYKQPVAPCAPAPPQLQQKGDRKQKKRDQNKTAALRYRQRKRAECEALDDECQSLEARNRELKEKADSIEREIQYVKDLLIEVYKARSQRLRTT